jgi:uncharacterized repeat protein (TIGR01451 family)
MTRVAAVAAVFVATLVLTAVAVAAETSAPGWTITSISRPTNFSSSDYTKTVEEVIIKGTGGTFTLSFKGQSTGALACNASAATVQSQLEAIQGIGAGNIVVTGGPTACSETNTTPYVIAFQGPLTTAPGGELVVTSALSGANAIASATNRTQGATADQYDVLVTNVGGAPSTAGAVVRDTLPAGVTATGISAETVGNTVINCQLASLTCTLPILPTFETADISIEVLPGTAASSIRNSATVQGGGAAAVASVQASPNTVNSASPAPAITNFSFDATDEDGLPASEAATHPYAFTVSFDTSTQISEIGASHFVKYETIGGELKEIAVNLPLGFIGNPLATPARCPLLDMDVKSGLPTCPQGSVVGYVALKTKNGGQGSPRRFLVTGSRSTEEKGYSPIYNMVPEAGYPAELAVEVASKAVFLYAGVVRTPSGYGLRVEVPSLTRAAELTFGSLTLFGDPAREDGVTERGTAFFTSPADCASSAAAGSIEANYWTEPANWVNERAVAYPYLGGCSTLAFDPTLAFTPSRADEGGTSQADEPSAYTVGLTSPQTTGIDERATPDVKNVTVTLPEGVSVSPAAAGGLRGCREAGSEGIDVPIARTHPDEAGEGEEVGPDGLAHLAAGHCPESSVLGTVEVSTPLLPNPLTGHVYLAQPKCGGASQPACTEGSATDGELYGLYIEAAGEGVVVKLPGTVAASPSTGQLVATFKENPQLPFEELKLHFDGGPRAPLANPQTCGTVVAGSDLTAWSGGLGGTPDVTEPSAPFAIDWDGHGGVCPSNLPFTPSLSAGTEAPTAGGYSPLTVTFGRQDREQDISSVQVKTPPGLLGMLSHVALCGEPQAQTGSCGAESLIGTTTVGTGAGEHPLYLGGRVYLTGPYNGAPFGLSIVVPAVAGPFNLGNVIVQAAIDIDPNTAALTITSRPLPQIIDGVPLRLRTINVTVNRPEFTFNATNCGAQQISATLVGAHGAAALTSTPYAASGCADLPFKPSLTAITQAKTSKADGASLNVKISQKPGEANIQKVELEIPKALPTRDSTLNKACLEAQFNANPAGCPSGSVIGIAKAITPTLDIPLTGPAILVSHGGSAFPDIEFILQGQGVTIVLDGKTQIKSGVTYSRFETVPDAPITSFETSFPEGPYSILSMNLPASAKNSMCAQNLVMPTIVVGQNGAERTQVTKITTSDCLPTIAIAKAKIGRGGVVVLLKASAAGKVELSGSGLRTVTKTVKAGSQTIRVPLTKAGRSKAQARKKVALIARLVVGHRTVSKTISVKL